MPQVEHLLFSEADVSACPSGAALRLKAGGLQTGRFQRADRIKLPLPASPMISPRASLMDGDDLPPSVSSDVPVFGEGRCEVHTLRRRIHFGASIRMSNVAHGSLFGPAASRLRSSTTSANPSHAPTCHRDFHGKPRAGDYSHC